MGHRLGALEGLARYGVDAIALDDGVAAFEGLVLGGTTTTSIMVTSRFGQTEQRQDRHLPGSLSLSSLTPGASMWPPLGRNKTCCC
jgi:hypothetical protein